MMNYALWVALLGIGAVGLVACGSEGAGDGLGPSEAGNGGGHSSTGGTSMATGGGPGAVGGNTGNPASGGTDGSGEADGGSGGAGGPGGPQCGGEPLIEVGGDSFDCGPAGHVFENAGRPDNRVNYVIVGDGYTEDLLETTYIEHIENMLYHEQAGQYSAIGEPYGRYRKFVNVCALKIASNDACIDNADIGRFCDTPFDGRCVPGCGSGGTRLGTADRNKVNAALAELLPESIDVDWSALTLNGDENGWWNSGGPLMVWNGNFGNRLNAASVALHEGGHTFHRLADEYGGTSSNCGEFQEINSTANPNAAKWSHWLEFDDVRNDDRARPNNQSSNPYGTRVQGAFLGSRYCDSGQYRPSQHSQMNLLPRPFNMPSVEKIILDIYAIVDPIDAHTDNSEPLFEPGGLQVKVVDPEVIHLQWSIDGDVVEENGGECFELPGLPSGQHTVTARAYDDTPWVRLNREAIEQVVTWEVVIP